MRSKLLLGLLVGGLAMGSMATRADETNDIDLKLFGKDVIQGWEGCRFGLWQKNRDPVEDRYAYVFFAPIPDGEALPGWVRIGDEIGEVSRVEIGSADTGMLEPFRLYRSHDGETTIMMEIRDQTRSDRGIEIHDGRLTFLRKDKFPFPIRVAGLNGCPGFSKSTNAPQEDRTAAAPLETGLSLGRGLPVESLDQVPAPVLRAVATQATDCAPENTPGHAYAFEISDAMMLWQVPCELFATQASSVFVVGWTYYPDQATLLYFPAVPGMGINDYAAVMSATVDPATATITSHSLDSGGDCGSYDKFQLVDAEGETVEFTRLEFREKTVCDGAQSDPSTFPLVYQGR